MGKNVITSGVDMTSSAHIVNKKKYILILGFGLTRGLDDTTLTAEAQYLINFSKSHKKNCFSLHYKESNRFLFVNTTKIYQFKVNSKVFHLITWKKQD